MGVRGLEGFMERDKTIAYTVNLKQKAEEFKRRTKVDMPMLVVDLAALEFMIYTNQGLDWICGGQYKEYQFELDRFIRAFQSVGIKLFFVDDGGVPLEKFNTWVRRRVNTVEKDVRPMFAELPKRLLDTEGWTPVKTETQARKVLANALKIDVLRSELEADMDVVLYAKKMGAMGILGQDSDFVLYDSDVPYFSAKHLDISAMTTLCYDRKALANRLGLTKPSQLALFGLFAGNDKIDRDTHLRNFHKNVLTGVYYQPDRLSNKNLFYEVAKHITRNFSGGYDSVQSQAHAIARLYTSSKDMTSVVKSLIEEFYVRTPPPLSPESCLPPDDDTWTKVLRLFCHNPRHPDKVQGGKLSSVMRRLLYWKSVSLEDYRPNHSIPPSEQLWSQVRRRAWGILLLERPEAHDGNAFLVDVTEYVITCDVPGDADVYSPQLSRPIHRHHSGLVSLHTDRDCDRLEAERWALFAWIISPSMNPDTLNRLVEPADVMLYATLFCMQHEWREPILRQLEVDAFIVHHFLLKTMSVDDLRGQPRPSYPLTARSIQLAALYTRNMVYLVNKIVGRPVDPAHLLLPCNFDGILFQKTYLSTMAENNWRHLVFDGATVDRINKFKAQTGM